MDEQPKVELDDVMLSPSGTGVVSLQSNKDKMLDMLKLLVENSILQSEFQNERNKMLRESVDIQKHANIENESMRRLEFDQRQLLMLPCYDIFVEIVKERVAQDEKYGLEHDDKHDTWDWVRIIKFHTKCSIDRSGEPPLPAHEMFRYQMVQVAALAVAAIEWADRKKP